MATQNPIEQEGTYPLPEAQLDRFLLHVVVDYPDQNAERDILQLVRNELINQDHDQPETAIKEITQHDILQARQQVLTLFMSEAVEEYIVQLVIATRDPGRYDARLSQLLEYGASPRATLALDRCARANAWLRGADFVSPDDVQAVAYDVLRHRIILSFEAEANGISADQVISDLISNCLLYTSDAADE